MDPRITAMQAETRRAQLIEEAAQARRVKKAREQTPPPVSRPAPVPRVVTA